MYEKFEKLMKDRGTNATQVAKGTGIPRSIFTDWKKGRLTPKYDKIKKIADYFHVDVDTFYSDGDAVQTSGQQEYYINPETAEIAQKIYDSKNLRLLFNEAVSADPNDIETAYTMLLALKRKEKHLD